MIQQFIIYHINKMIQLMINKMYLVNYILQLDQWKAMV